MKRISIILLFLLSSSSIYAGSWHDGDYTSVWGSRSYKLFLPNSYQTVTDTKKIPVIIALHGCMQDAESFSGGTRLNTWADKLSFAVVYIQQKKNNNIYNCWNWFYPFNQRKGMGEAQIIMKTTDKLIKEYQLNFDKLFVLGMSAGAAQTNILINCYPERFKAFASHHGVMYKGAQNPATAREIVQSGPLVSPEYSALKGFECSRIVNSDKLIPGVVIHGKKGAVMKVIHATKVVEEVLAFNDYLDNGMRDKSLHLKVEEKYIHPRFKNSYQVTNWVTKNKILLKKVLVDDLGHAWSGGDNQWEFNDPHGPDATKIILDFFKSYGL